MTSLKQQTYGRGSKVYLDMAADGNYNSSTPCLCAEHEDVVDNVGEGGQDGGGEHENDTPAGLLVQTKIP
jgi:hypothetical protein